MTVELFIGAGHFMENLLGFLIMKVQPDMLALSGWYFSAFSLYACLISFLLAFLLTPNTS